MAKASSIRVIAVPLSMIAALGALGLTGTSYQPRMMDLHDLGHPLATVDDTHRHLDYGQAVGGRR